MTILDLVFIVVFFALGISIATKIILEAINEGNRITAKKLDDLQSTLYNAFGEIAITNAHTKIILHKIQMLDDNAGSGIAGLNVLLLYLITKDPYWKEQWKQLAEIEDEPEEEIKAVKTHEKIMEFLKGEPSK